MEINKLFEEILSGSTFLRHMLFKRVIHLQRSLPPKKCIKKNDVKKTFMKKKTTNMVTFLSDGSRREADPCSIYDEKKKLYLLQ